MGNHFFYKQVKHFKCYLFIIFRRIYLWKSGGLYGSKGQKRVG